MPNASRAKKRAIAAGQSNFQPVATLDQNNNPNSHTAAISVLIAFQEHVLNQMAHAHATHAG